MCALFEAPGRLERTSKALMRPGELHPASLVYGPNHPLRPGTGSTPPVSYTHLTLPTICSV
eukprot:2759808-Alexandrium_andersonii.AAC.1